MSLRHPDRDVVCPDKSCTSSHANEEFKAIVLDYNLPVVTTQGMDEILGFLTSLVDLRTINPHTPHHEAAVAGLELRCHNANLNQFFNVLEEC
eukprot:9371213-Prorocentrum_lima.AAC.1